MPSGVSSFLRGLMTTAVATPSSKKEGEKSFLLLLSFPPLPLRSQPHLLFLLCVASLGGGALRRKAKGGCSLYFFAKRMNYRALVSSFFPCGGSETQSVIRTHRVRTSALQYDDEDRVRAFSFLPSGLFPRSVQGRGATDRIISIWRRRRRGYPSLFFFCSLSLLLPLSRKKGEKSGDGMT